MKNPLVIIGLLILSLGSVELSYAEDADLEYHNVVVVLDASGSMGDMMRHSPIQKMDAAKQALSAVLKHVSPNTQVGILVFSAKNIDDDWLYPLGPIEPDRLQQAINRPLPGYKTPLGEYIKKGADRLLKQREAQYGYGSYRLLIVTDGEASDPVLVDRYVPEVMTRGIGIDVIGVDMRQTHTLATKVNSYRKADDPQSLIQAMSEVFAEVSGAGSDTADAETFDEITAIPVELAGAMVKALAVSGNQPIGSLPQTTPPPVPPPTRKQRAPAAAPTAPHPPTAIAHYAEILFFAAVIFIALLVIRRRKK